ncbi:MULTISPECIES: hypothetical protein [Pseudomonas syringae group]|uniref:hypothetical protein n=1 Tax=Pseudomonas syringae group TaxID=136849 RepID=UPI001F137F5A|nr:MULTISPECIES: hypothetical protein [Pseudomonas syringae group]
MARLSLNGWQRLWVVAAVSMGLFLMLAGEYLVPTEKMLAAEFDKPLAEQRRYLAEVIQRQRETDAFSQRFFPQSEIENTEARIQQLQNQYTQKQNSLWRDKFTIRGVIAVVWLVLCAGLYCIGAGCGWIIRGFRPTEKSGS